MLAEFPNEMVRSVKNFASISFRDWIWIESGWK